MNNNKWMHSFRSPRLGPIDARVSILLLITLMHISKLTFTLSVVSIIALLYIERWKRISLPSALRWIVCSLTTAIFTPTRYARAIEKRTNYIDNHDIYLKNR